MKKCLCAILAALMIFSSFALPSFAVWYSGEGEEKFTEGYVYTGEGVINNVVYSLEYGKTCANKKKHKFYEIKSLFDSEETAKNATKITFVDEINGIPVETIEMKGVQFLQENNKIKELVLPSKLCYVNPNAFSDLNALETVIFPKGTQKFWLDEGAFSSLKSLKKVVVRGGDVTIGEGAFYNCTALKTVTFDVKSVYFGDSAFSGCAALKSIKFPAKSYLAEGSFAGTGFKSLTIPATAILGDEGVFSFCKSLETVKFTASSSVKKFMIADEVFFYCTKLKTVVLPKKAKDITICPKAFAGCTALKNVENPGLITVVGEEAFLNCKRLENIKFSSRIKAIAKNAFMGCSRLKSVTFKDTKNIPGSYNYDTIKFTKGFEAGTFSGTPSGIKFYVKNATVAKKLKTALKGSGVKKAKIYRLSGNTLYYKNVK